MTRQRKSPAACLEQVPIRRPRFVVKRNHLQIVKWSDFSQLCDERIGGGLAIAARGNGVGGTKQSNVALWLSPRGYWRSRGLKHLSISIAVRVRRTKPALGALQASFRHLVLICDVREASKGS